MTDLIFPPEFIHCTGILEDRFSSTAFHAVLPNGKKTIAFVEQKDFELLPLLSPGDCVNLTICPADFDRARITSLAKSDR